MAPLVAILQLQSVDRAGPLHLPIFCLKRKSSTATGEMLALLVAAENLGSVLFMMDLLLLLTPNVLDKEEINLSLVREVPVAQATKRGAMGSTRMAVALFHPLTLGEVAMGMEVVALALWIFMSTCPGGVVGVDTKEAALATLLFEVITSVRISTTISHVAAVAALPLSIQLWLNQLQLAPQPSQVVHFPESTTILLLLLDALP
jgi:hypothetical protein